MINEYFAKRKEKRERRRNIESIREHGRKYGRKPDTIFEVAKKSAISRQQCGKGIFKNMKPIIR